MRRARPSRASPNLEASLIQDGDSAVNRLCGPVGGRRPPCRGPDLAALRAECADERRRVHGGRPRRPPPRPAEDGGLRHGPRARAADPRGREGEGAVAGALLPRRPRRVEVGAAGGDAGALRRHDGVPRAGGGVPRLVRRAVRGDRREPRPRGDRRVRDRRGQPRGDAQGAQQADDAVQARGCREDAARRPRLDRLPRRQVHVARGDDRRRAARVVRGGRLDPPGRRRLEDLRLHPRAADRLGAPRAAGAQFGATRRAILPRKSAAQFSDAFTPSSCCRRTTSSTAAAGSTTRAA